MPRQIRIIEQNPQTAPERIPGYRESLKFNPTSHVRSVFQTMSLTRAIPIVSGEVLIVDEGRSGTEASNFTLATPSRRNASEAGNDGARLEIISACPMRHVVRTAPGVINGNGSTITFEGFGAIELLAHSGVWIVTSAQGVSIT